MTDNEIIKAIQFCKENNTILGCRKCPYVECDTDNGCLGELLLDTLELINRQKAEIERLQDYIENLRCINTDLTDNLAYLSNEAETARAEAVKEFAFMLKAMAAGRLAWDEYDEEICGFLAVDEIDNLVKEFTEGKPDGDSM